MLADNFNMYKQRDIISGMNYAFNQLIVDAITDKHASQSITVVVSKLNLDDDSDDFYVHSHSQSNAELVVSTITTTAKTTATRAGKSSSKGGVNTMMSFRIHIWCSMHASMISSTNALHQVEVQVGSAVNSLLRYGPIINDDKHTLLMHCI